MSAWQFALAVFFVGVVFAYVVFASWLVYKLAVFLASGGDAK